MKVKVKKLHPDAVVPKYGRDGDAGLDLTAVDNGTPFTAYEEYSYTLNDRLKTGHRVVNEYIEYKTGLAIEIPKGYVGYIFPRSSISNYSLSLCNAVGVVDSNYRGEVSFRFRVLGDYAVKYKKGDRIGQLIIMPYPEIELEEVTELSDSERGSQGYGSSGK